MKKLLALVLAFGMIFSLCACGENSTDNEPANDVNNDTTQTSSKEETTPKFEVTVTDVDGNPMPGFTVQICSEGIGCLPSKTNDDGVATFNVEITSDYSLKLFNPDQYEIVDDDQEIYLEDGATEYTIKVKAKEVV